MNKDKLYVGAKLRELRGRLGLSQTETAKRLGISLPYLNQMEHNHRPVSASVIVSLAEQFGFDVSELASGDAERIVSDLKEAFADPIFQDAPPLADMRLTASNAPSFARNFLALHRAYREASERLASLDAALGQKERTLSPWEEVRDFFHYCDNYIDAVDRSAEIFAQGLGDDPAGELEARLNGMGIRVALKNTEKLRMFDGETLTLSAQAPFATQLFQMYHQWALIERGKLLDATLDLARFQSDDARQIAKVGLANYFAGAALMPYGKFLSSARELRHDLERLATQYSASIEQVAHRLSTLQRPSAKGIPFFFVRVDQAGQITKRHSSTRLQFARFGGACPLWNVHRAFETPGRFLRQLAQTPDGASYFCLARDISKTSGSFQAPVRRFAIGLGCEIKHASELVYSDGMDLSAPCEPIGISCRICERTNCHQRSVPPLERKLKLDQNARGLLPYDVDG